MAKYQHVSIWEKQTIGKGHSIEFNCQLPIQHSHMNKHLDMQYCYQIQHKTTHARRMLSVILTETTQTAQFIWNE